jgi:hypothetical protein
MALDWAEFRERPSNELRDIKDRLDAALDLKEVPPQ